MPDEPNVPDEPTVPDVPDEPTVPDEPDVPEADTAPEGPIASGSEPTSDSAHDVTPDGTAATAEPEPSASSDSTRIPRPTPRTGATAVVRAGRAGLRVLAGAVAVGIAAATVWAVTTMPLPGQAVTPPSQVVRPAPGEQARVCPGPFVTLGVNPAAPTDPGLRGTATVAGAGDTSLVTAAGVTGLAAQGATPSLTTAPGAAAYTLPGSSVGEPTAIALAQSVQLADPRATGFAATACTSPTADQWIVGAASTTGRSAQLSIVNPSDVTAVVRADVMTPDGAVGAPALVDMELPAHTQRTVSLEGVAPGAAGFAVHVTSTGGPVAASVHELTMSGLTPLGIDIIGPTAAPSTRLDVVGVPFTSTAAEAEDALFSERGAVFRLLVPGDEAADATVTVRGLDGVALDPVLVRVQPGVVTDIPLSGFPVGRYTVSVESTQPVVGAVRSSAVGERVDSAWFAASTPLDDRAWAAVPTGPTPRLNIANPGAGPVSFEVRVGGATQSVDLAPGATWQQDVAADAAIDLSDVEGLVASVTYDGPGQLAGMPVLPGNPLAGDITVYR